MSFLNKGSIWVKSPGFDRSDDKTQFFTKSDLGFTVGGGLKIPLKIGNVFAEVTHTWGTKNRDKDSDYVIKNRTLSIVGGYEFCFTPRNTK